MTGRPNLNHQPPLIRKAPDCGRRAADRELFDLVPRQRFLWLTKYSISRSSSSPSGVGGVASSFEPGSPLAQKFTLHELFARIHVTTVCLLDRRLREEAKHGARRR
jgi:hypothetical protein